MPIPKVAGVFEPPISVSLSRDAIPLRHSPRAKYKVTGAKLAFQESDLEFISFYSHVAQEVKAK